MTQKEYKKSTQLFNGYSAPFVLFFVIAFAYALLPQQAFAAWNTPTCNPDDVGPTHSSCNVSAPLNVSDADQVKTGAIEVQNTVSAEDLVISNSFSGTGNGRVTITTSNGNALTITQNHTTSRSLVINQNGSSAVGVDVTVNSTANAVAIQQNGASNALRASTAANSYSAVVGIKTSNNDGYGGYFEANSNTANAAGILVRNLNATGKSAGVFYNGAFAPSAIPGTGRAALNVQTNAGYGGYFYSTSDTAIYAQSSQNGVYATTSGNSYSGVVGIKSSNNDGYGGYFEANSNTNNAAGIMAQNKSTSGKSAGVFYNGGIAPIIIPGVGRAGVNVQTSTGYGGFFYSTDVTNGVGVVGNGAAGGVNGYTTTGSYGVYGSATSSSGSGGYFSASGATGYGVYGTSTNYVGVWGTGTKGGVVGTTSGAGYNGVFGENNGGTTGYGGYFLANTTNAGLRVNNTNSSSGYGAHITSAGNTSTALYVENTNSASGYIKYGIQTTVTTPSGVGIKATSHYGKAGEFTSNSGGYPIYVNGSGSSAGIYVDVDGYDTAIETPANSVIKNDGGYVGGQFYASHPYAHGDDMTAAAYVEAISVSSAAITDMLYDGSDIWIADGSSDIYRMSPLDGRLTATYSTITDVNELYLSGDTVRFIDWSEGIDLYSNYTPTVYTGHTMTGTPSANTYFRGASASHTWYGTNSGKVYNTLSNSTEPTRIYDGAGIIYEMTQADDYVWVTTGGDDKVLKINAENASDYTEITDADIDLPVGIVFDGTYIWVASYTAQKLVRIHADTEEVTSYDMSSVGRPTRLGFDGVNIWVSFYTGELYTFNVANGALDREVYQPHDRILQMIYDGNYMWVGTNDGYVIKYTTGHAANTSSTLVTKGIYIMGQNGTLYCVYINSGGTLVRGSTSNCS